MKWFYVVKGKKEGPVSEEEVKELVQRGIIKSDSLVWNEEISKWVRYGTIGVPKTVRSQPQESHDDSRARSEGDALGSNSSRNDFKPLCAECGKAFPEDEMIVYGDARICSSCKPTFFQKLKEGASLSVAMTYAGFWIRFGAKIIDGIVLAVPNMIFSFVGGLAVSSSFASAGRQGMPSTRFIGSRVVTFLLQVAFAAAYATFFVGKFGATPGKMACGIKVVTPECGQVSYPRALGRHFAEYLSSFTLCIGFLMAAFDEEKRTLHDRICNTRVIKQ